MTILVIAEHDNKVLAPATLNTVAAAAKIGGDIHVLVAGHMLAPWLKPRQNRWREQSAAGRQRRLRSPAAGKRGSAGCRAGRWLQPHPGCRYLQR